LQPCQPEDREAAYKAAEGDAIALRALDLLYELEGSAAYNRIREALGKGAGGLAKLEDAGIIAREVKGRRRVSDKTVSIASLAVSSEEAAEAARIKRRGSPQQAELLRLLSSLGEASVKELRYFTGASVQSVKALEKAGYISLRQAEAFRKPEYEPSGKPLMDTLSESQRQAYEGLKALLETGGAAAALLYGVTGSGKTAVYIRLIRAAIDRAAGPLSLSPKSH
jgi:primosomal protein N' (replication factor Y)